MAQPSSATTGSIDWVEPEGLALDRTEVSLDTAGVTDPREETDLFIRLDEPAVTEFVADQVQRGRAEPSANARRAQAQRVEQQQDQLRAELRRLGVDERSSMQVGANGLRVRAPAQDMAALSELPGVVSVAPVTLHEQANETSVPWINAPDAWEALGFTGEDIIISIIDTGIDYTHASFEGSGDVADYEFIAEDTTVIPEVGGEPVFPTAKVTDGYDFAGVNYDASGEVGSPVPEPDPNPLDVNGHGSHVGGSAAGVEVRNENGDVSVGSGVAPGATLYAAKVFGDITGSTALTADAIEWSLDPKGDGSMEGQAHVINMSLGSTFGHPDDPTAIATQNAVEAGTVVVSSAGNSGHNAAYITGSPAVAPGAISVAASIDGGHSVLGLEVHEPAEVAGVYEAVESAISLPLEETGPLTEEVAAVEPSIACEPDGDGGFVPRVDNPEDLVGKVAFVERGSCPFAMKHLAVQDAGAAAVLVYNNLPGEPIAMGGDSAGIDIPGMMISQSDGALLVDQLNAGETVSVTMSSDIQIPKPELADHLASFSSRGPGGGGSGFKPDVSAPGFAIDSAAVGGGDAARTISGTSMASPHVAGLAALVANEQGLPDIEDVEEKAAAVGAVKSLIMNTAVPSPEDYPLALQGTGIVRADRAVTADAYTTPAGLSFGRLNPLEATTVTETVTVTNEASTERTFDIAFEAMQEVPGVTVSHDDTVTVPAEGTASFEVTLSLDPTQMPAEAGAFSQTEADGWLALDDGALELRAGVLAVVDPAAAVQVAPEAATPFDPTNLTVGNSGPADGISEGLTLAGVGDDAGGIIEALGVRTGVVGGSDVIQFGLATEGWDSLSSRETQILLDVDQDGVDDLVLVAADRGLLLGAEPTGTVATALFDLATGAGALHERLVDGDYHDEVQVLTVDRLLPTGFLEPGDTDFDYAAATFVGSDLIGVQEGTIDLSEGVDDRQNPSLAVPAGAEETLEFPTDDERDMLWLHPANVAGEQFQVVPLEAVQCDRTITRTHIGPLAITDEVVCLDGAMVIGPVKVQDGGGLAAVDSRVVGPVSANGAQLVQLEDTAVTGPVKVNGVSGGVVVSENRVTGPVTLTDNSTDGTPIVVSGNRIIGPLGCTGNEPAPTNDGVPNMVTGPQTGQCADL